MTKRDAATPMDEQSPRGDRVGVREPRLIGGATEHASVQLSGGVESAMVRGILADGSDALTEDCVQRAWEADQFERAALGLPALVVVDAPAAERQWRIGALLRAVGSVAAAAVLAVGVFVALQKPPAGSGVANGRQFDHAGGGAGGQRSETLASDAVRAVAGEGTVQVASASTTDALTASGHDLEAFGYLDQALLEGGLPTITGERSLVLAVYRGTDAGCDCLKWSVGEPGDPQAKPAALANALKSPCGASADEVTLISITGPRDLLPFHDDDARELVQCLTEVTAPAGEVSSEEADVLQSALATLCLPAQLQVQTLSVNLASR